MNKRTKKISLITLMLIALIVVTAGFIFISNALSKKVYASTYNESLTVEENNVVASNAKSLSKKSAAAASAANAMVILTFNDGEQTLTGKIVTDGTMPMLDIDLPQKENYTFLGFYYNNEQYYNEKLEIVHGFDFTSQFVTLYAKWESKSITISLDHNGGNSSTDSILISYGSDFNNVEIPKKEGYSFEGYKYLGKIVFYKDGRPVTDKCEYTSDITLIADWTLINYEIKIQVTNPDVNGELPQDYIDEVWKTYSIEDLATADYIIPPLYDGNLKMNFTPNKIEKGSTGEKIIYGTWMSVNTVITYELNGGTNSESNKTYLIDGEVLKLDEAYKLGCAFMGWYFNGNKVHSITGGDVEVAVLTAKWAENRISGLIYDLNNLGPYETELICTANTTYILPDYNFFRPLTITIDANVDNVHIYAKEFLKYDLRIAVYNRVKDFNLYLENFTMCAPYGNGHVEAIVMDTPNNSALNLYNYGLVSIQGGGGTTSKTGNGLDGAYAIKCSTLYIRHVDHLIINGGTAGFGAEGYSDGKPAYAIYVEKEYYLAAVPYGRLEVSGGIGYNNGHMYAVAPCNRVGVTIVEDRYINRND